MKRWQYDFNASGSWIVDSDGFTVVGHMPITVEQTKTIVQEHNRMLDLLYEEAAFKLGFVRYADGQKVTPPDHSQEWWYRKDRPDGDWFNNAQQAVEAYEA